MNATKLTQHLIRYATPAAVFIAVIGCSALPKSKTDPNELDPREVARIAAADPFPIANEPPPRK